jgi:hypothetical protein
MASMSEAGVGQPAPAKSSNVQKPRYREPPMRKLTCYVERNYGTIKIGFGVEAEYTPENESDQQRYWNLLYKQVNEMHDDWALVQLPKVKAVAEEAIPEQVYDAVSLVRDDKDGKPRYRIQTEPGTSYGKYGITVPKEVEETAIELTSSEYLRNGETFVMKKGVKIAVKKLEHGSVITRIWKE